MFRLLAAAVMFGLGTGNVTAAEWWEDKFVYDAADDCDNEDSVATYSGNTVEGWEYSCTITKKTPLTGLSAIIFDLSCEGLEGEEPWTERRVLFRGEGNSVGQFPPFEKLRRCSVPVGPPEWPDTGCGEGSSLFKAIFAREDKLPAYQELQLPLQRSAGDAFLTEYRNGRRIWASRGEYMCTNGASICSVSFPVMGGSEPIRLPLELVEGKRGPMVVIPAFAQILYYDEKSSVDAGKPYGGLVADLYGGYAPGKDELVQPQNIYTFSGCIRASKPVETP